ncbi:hypothetical protein D3C83_324610 [compost metagenome]
MESGSQTCSGTCADLPMAPMNRQMQMNVISDQLPNPAMEIVSSASIGACRNTPA